MANLGALFVYIMDLVALLLKYYERQVDRQHVAPIQPICIPQCYDFN